ncbi:hypothetical protein Aph01nite_59130 [Acrocarpospora phusangensis]|uniref:Uncharacterized protein n=1 Tax=Acrocarpospora phusangensis TaxID=1070424 RepID=A0A919URL2_9ACTN|nr:hypothetical protein [Acrocarpospora phusangensis]GIH27603.1 hypothetical protein Aph01nite_59130 [Acrocarpospora phusangensis]
MTTLIPAPTEPKIRVPYVIAYSGELRTDPIWFGKDRYGRRLRYMREARGDWNEYGALRARVGQRRNGQPLWRKLNTARQWRCMEKLLCQVCGQPATCEDGRIPWILTDRVVRDDDRDPGVKFTSAPPTCLACIPEARELCPQLHGSFSAYSVGGVGYHGVLADMYEPGLKWEAIPTGERNVEIPFVQSYLLRVALAHQLLVRLSNLHPLPISGPS